MPEPDSPQPDEDRVRRSFAAWNAGDLDGWLGEAHPEAEYGPGIVIGRTEGEHVVYRGHDELRRFFDEWHSVWHAELALGAVERIGERILILGRMRLTGPHSGATVEQEAGWVGETEDGLLRRLWSYPSHESARKAIAQLGPAEA